MEKNSGFSHWVMDQSRVLSSGNGMLEEEEMRNNFNLLFYANSTRSEMSISEGLAPLAGTRGTRPQDVPKPWNSSLLAPSSLLFLMRQSQREEKAKENFHTSQSHPSSLSWSFEEESEPGWAGCPGWWVWAKFPWWPLRGVKDVKVAHQLSLENETKQNTILICAQNTSENVTLLYYYFTLLLYFTNATFKTCWSISTFIFKHKKQLSLWEREKCCGLGSDGLTTGVNVLRSLFQPEQFCDCKRGLDLWQDAAGSEPGNDVRMVPALSSQWPKHFLLCLGQGNSCGSQGKCGSGMGFGCETWCAISPGGAVLRNTAYS